MPRLALMPTALAAALLLALPASAKTLKPVRNVEATEDFAGKKPDKAAKDVSGLACLPANGEERRCLLANDENRSAQFAILSKGRIKPADVLELIGDSPSPTALGAIPTSPCPTTGGYGEFDGEAVAYAAPYFYVAGSHGCSRNSSEFRLSSFQLARVKVDTTGNPIGQVELTYRLSDLLRRTGEVAPFFGKPLTDGNGLNIEGIATAHDRLWIGLRAPSQNGRAFLLETNPDELFAPGNEPAQGTPTVISFPAGPNRGVRDLAALRDGRLLVLVGPAQEQDVPYGLLLLDPAAPQSPRDLGTLAPPRDAKAEVVTILEERPGRLRFLIGYDGVKNGRFQEYELQLP